MYISKKLAWIAVTVLLLALAFFAVRSDYFQNVLIPIVHPKYVDYINPNIPPGFQFTDPEEEIPEEFLVEEGFGSYDTCSVFGQTRKEVVYYRLNSGNGFVGSSRSAHVCGNEYIIYSYSNHTDRGVSGGVYGPFKLDRITNEGNLYSIQIPKDWKIIEDDADEVAVDNTYQSSLQAESSDWKKRVESDTEGPCSDSYFEAGAYLEIYTEEGEEKDFTHYGHGGGIDPEEVTQEKNITIDGVPAVYHVFTDNCTVREGQQLDAHVNHKGTSYYFRLSYSPAKYPQGEKVFMDILNSVKFVSEEK